MKKNILNIIIITTFLILFGCSDDKFNANYNDPTGLKSAEIPKLMTGVFEKGDKYTMPWYIRYFSFETQQIARYSQTLGWINNSGMYLNSESNNDDRWKQFYSMVTQYTVLENNYAALNEIEKHNYEMFLIASKIYLYDHLQQMIDLWGDLPFQEAGTLFYTSNINESKPSYQLSTNLYQMAMDDLKNMNHKLSKIILDTEPEKGTITSTVVQKFVTQDYINEGNLKKWQKYCNSLRLRYASRAAEQGNLSTQSQNIVKEILSDPNKYPVISSNDDNILINYKAIYYNAFEGGSEGIKGGFESWNGLCNRASKKMIDMMTNGATLDPRFHIMFDPNKQGQYNGIDPLMEASKQTELFYKLNSNNKSDNFFASIDSATFSQNNKFPGIIMTASEISYIKAEAIEKWGLAGDSKAAFIDGFKQSVDFYFYLNSLGNYRKPLEKSNQAIIENFANEMWNKTTKIEAIATQKWLHYGNIQTVQAWSEYRKTKFPKLEYTPDNLTPSCTLPPERLKYTVNERSYNAENYEKVREKDTYTNKMFWAK